jgi:hypothetical protein
VVQPVGLLHLIANLDDRIERIFGVLHHHRDAAAAERLPIGILQADQILASKVHALRGHNAGRRNEPEESPSYCGFA